MLHSTLHKAEDGGGLRPRYASPQGLGPDMLLTRGRDLPTLGLCVGLWVGHLVLDSQLCAIRRNSVWG
jgi:hypothetical protein